MKPQPIQQNTHLNYFAYIKHIFALMFVKFVFYLLISIGYTWLLIGLKFKTTFDWNLVFLITISLLLFSVLFERPYVVEAKKNVFK